MSSMQSRIRLKLHWLAIGLATFAALFASSRVYAQGSPISNVQAITAPLAAPAQVAYDAAGNLYIADLNNNVIRKVNVAGVITTVAGTGEQGFSGDGGAATSASLDSPAGVAIDPSGNIYIADTHNQRIRKVSGGTITTIAGTGIAGFSGDGGSGTSATLSNPTALALDASGNLYIADTDNHRIRRISGTTITTVAGNGEQFFSGDNAAATAAGLDSPNGVAIDAAGNLYIGDTHNQRVRVVNTSGTITTLAGNSSKAYAGDGGAATASSLARPRGLSVDAQGNIYVADSDNNRIRFIANTGTISTVAGNGSQGYAGDGGPAINATLDTPRTPAVQSPGVFALSDTNNNLVRGVGVDGTIRTIAGVPPGTGGGVVLPGESLTLTGAPSVAYASGTLTAIFTNSNQIATGNVSLIDGAGSTPVATAALTSNVATIDVSALSAGTHNLTVAYAGDGQNPAITSSVFVLTVTPLPVTATASSVTILYGQSIPVITGTLTGVLPRDTNNVAAVFSTSATQTSTVGQYPITVALTGSAAGNYTVSLASSSGNLSIGKAASAITLSSSNIAPYLGAPVTLTAKVASTTTGTPTGNVVFYDGTTLLATTAVNAAGSAIFTSSSFAAGNHSITAVYGGDANFTGSSSSAALESVGPAPDFTFSASGVASVSVNPGQAATYNFTVQSQGGPFTSPITLTASGLPAGATAVFSPASLTLGSTPTSFSLAIQTSNVAAANTTSSSARWPQVSFSAVFFLLPLLRRKQVRAMVSKRLLAIAFVLLASGAVLGLAGCGDGGFFPQSQKTYTITVTATGTNSINATVQHTTTVTLVVQ